MKNLVYIILLLSVSNTFSQINYSSFKFNPSVSGYNLKATTFELNLNSNNNYLNSDILNLYNPMTNLNDNYYYLGQKHQLSTIKSFSNFGYEGRRIDSFNPYGTKDFGAALASGAINFLLGKF